MVLFIDMPSFDVVSKPDLQEIDNAINNTKREVDNRFDFKNSNSTIERKEFLITMFQSLLIPSKVSKKRKL